MSVIKSVQNEEQYPAGVKKYSSGLRLWHWANVIIISGSLITVLINSTLTDQRFASSLIQSKLKNAGAAINAAQARAAAHAFNDTVWDVHKYFGFCLAGLLLFRFILEFFQAADQRLIRKIKVSYQRFIMVKKNRQEQLHTLTVKVIYALFYCLLCIMVVTGLSLAFDDDIPILKPMHRNIKSIHGFCMYLVLAFIVAHLAGVFLAERNGDGKGIVSGMINGGDNSE